MWYNLKNGCSLKSTMLRLYVEIMNNDEYVYSNVNNEHTIIAMNIFIALFSINTILGVIRFLL